MVRHRQAPNAVRRPGELTCVHRPPCVVRVAQDDCGPEQRTGHP